MQAKPCTKKTAKGCLYWTNEPGKVSLCLKTYEPCIVWVNENQGLIKNGSK
jgi:hypothetical protein